MRPSLNDLKSQSFELISSQTSPQKKPRFSVTRVISNAIAATTLSLYIYADNLASGLLPDSAKSVVLERWAAIFGVSRKRASIASGEVFIESTQFTQVVKGTLMQDDLGNQYATTERQILGQETRPVKVESVETGRNKNQAPGVILTLVNPIAGINSSIEVGGAGLTGASDVESDDEFRVRILDRIKNPPRGGSIRAYEVIMFTKKSVFSWYTKTEPSFKKDQFIKIYVDYPKEILINKISKRVDQMMKNGAIQEVKDFLKLDLKSDSNIFKVIGIREIKEFIDKKISMHDLKLNIVIKTRQYAKRQRTWSRGHMTDWQKFDAEDLSKFIKNL